MDAGETSIVHEVRALSRCISEGEKAINCLAPRVLDALAVARSIGSLIQKHGFIRLVPLNLFQMRAKPRGNPTKA